VQFRTGGIWGLPVMKFTLTFDGFLPPSANKPKNEDKWTIRNQLSPQFKDLWSSHPALIEVEANRHFPKTGGTTLRQTHHLYPGPIEVAEWTASSKPSEILDLCEPIEKHGAWFRPLIRESYALHCGLKIIFLRQEPPGKVYQGGDIDGRIKTLLDGLTMPQHKEQVLATASKMDPIYCLLEDDSLVSGLDVESERLLTDKHNSVNFVRLIIQVDVRVKRAIIYNLSFLG
jgi:hypothetical protein